MSRLISAGTIVYDQVDFYYPSGTIIRPTGIVPANLAATIFLNNGLVSWPLVDGTLVPDSSVAAGTIYFNSVLGVGGFYSVRFFPHQIGYWRVVLRHNSYGIELVKNYDVVPARQTASGLNATFVK